jgi:hypothetical protein
LTKVLAQRLNSYIGKELVQPFATLGTAIGTLCFRQFQNVPLTIR